MNTKHMDYILAISETGNLSAASRRLGVTQPVLSRYLIRLEQELGTPVFVLKEHRYILTEAGQIYLRGIQRIKHLQAQMSRSLDAARNTHVPYLVIGLPYYFNGSEFADIYTELLLWFPSLKLYLTEGTSGELLKKLLEHRLDLLDLQYHPNWISDVKSAVYYRSEVLLVLPDDHSFAALGSLDFKHPAPLTIRQFQSIGDQPFVLYHTDHPIGRLSEEVLQRYQLNWNIVFRTGSPSAVNSFLKTGTYGGLYCRVTQALWIT